MRIIKILSIVFVIPVTVFILFLIHSGMADYQPKDIIRLGQPKIWDTLCTEKTLDILIWNIGHAGLDANMDYFFDGGKKVRPSENQVYENFSFIREFLEDNDTVKFILLQEVDRSSRRSYYFNQVRELKESLESYHMNFGKNHDVDFIPVPVTKPIGKVLSGIVTFTQFRPAVSYRYSLPGIYTWPKKTFMPDRCFLINRYHVNNSREFVLINVHISANDDSVLLKMQTEYLREYILNEYNEGNYVLAGGDWNQCPPLFKPYLLHQPFSVGNMSCLPEDFLPDSWTWAYQPDIPTSRHLSEKFVRGKTLTTITDFFLLSPNIELIHVKTVDIGFQYSDHQPVIASFKLP